MDLTVLFLAVPHLTADLKPTSAQLLWITDIYAADGELEQLTGHTQHAL